MASRRNNFVTLRPLALGLLILLAAVQPATAAGIEISEADATLQLSFHRVNVETLAAPSHSLFMGVYDASWKIALSRPQPVTTPVPLSRLFVGVADAALTIELKALPPAPAEVR